MPNVVANILGGPVVLWYAPVGEAIPDRDSIAAGAVWGGNWAKVGFTKEPLTMAYEFEAVDWNIQESLGAVARVKEGHTLTLETVLSEHDLNSFLLAFGGDLNEVAAGVGTVGYQQLDMGDVARCPEFAWGFEGSYVDANGVTFPVRLFVHKATAIAGGESEYGKGDYAGIPLQLSALSDMSQSEAQRFFSIERITAAAT